jgi:hypothetical protein
MVPSCPWRRPVAIAPRRGLWRTSRSRGAEGGEAALGQEALPSLPLPVAGVVAGVSGAIKTRLAGGYLQEMLPSMAQQRAYLEATAYNLRPVLRLLISSLRPWPLSPPPIRCSY